MRERLALRISEAKAKASGVPACTGIDDCVLWIANIYCPILGRDPAARYRGMYYSLDAADRLLRGCGIGPAVMRAARQMGWSRIHPATADVGDFALVAVAGEINAAIFDGQLWVRRIDGGYAGYPHAMVRKAWDVTCSDAQR